MRLKFKIYYASVVRFVEGRKVSLFADTCLFVGSGYLLAKKGLDISFSNWLRNHAFSEGVVTTYLFVSGVVLSLALGVKLVALVAAKYPASTPKQVEPERISACLLIINGEVVTHIDKCDSSVPLKIRHLSDEHAFERNVAVVIECLVEHLRGSLESDNIKRRDIFISLYVYNDSNETLEYMLHFQPNRDVIKSKVIYLDDTAFEHYECVKCIKSPHSTAYVLDGSLYRKGNSKRHKTLKHYMGCKLEGGRNLYGFLTVEFHNKEIFFEEGEMHNFMEEHVFPFKLLLEYQFLKGSFFKRFSAAGDLEI